MSKYRLTPIPSKHLLILKSVVYLLAMMASLLWKADVMFHQSSVQWATCVMLAGLWIWDIRSTLRQQKGQKDTIWLVDEQGQFESIQPSQFQRLIGTGSRVTPFLLWLQLCERADTRRREWHWVFRDQLDELGYRRLCRIILKTQSANHE